MPVDVTFLLTPADRKLVARAKRRSKKAAAEMIARIADRAARTAAAKNRKIEREIKDDTDRSGFEAFLTRPLRRRGGEINGG